MNPADRMALVDRLARARSWNALAESERTLYRRTAESDLDELEIEKSQTERIGWLFVELETEPVE